MTVRWFTEFPVTQPNRITMPTGSESFDLQATLNAVGDAFTIVLCRIGFEAGAHGLLAASVVGMLGFYLWRKRHRAGRPLLMVCRKLVIVCGIMVVPGLIAMVTAGKLPQVGTLQLNSIGLLGFWTLVILHLSMEEMNFEWFKS